MLAMARRDEADWRRRRRRWIRRQKQVEQGTRPNTSMAQLTLQLKTASTRAVSTPRWRQRRRRKAKPVQGLRHERTAMGPQPTDQANLRTRGGTKNPGEGAQRQRK